MKGFFSSGVFTPLAETVDKKKKILAKKAAAPKKAAPKKAAAPVKKQAKKK